MASPNAAGTSGAKDSSLTTLISLLERRNIAYFYKVMTKSSVTEIVQGPFAYSLEFPLSFVRAHGTSFAVLATFRRTNRDQAWPIKVTVKEDPPTKHRVFAYGPGGWKAFVVDNDIQVGDTLVFSLVGFSSFMVDIIKAPPAEDSEEEDSEEDSEEEDPPLDPFPFGKNIEEASVPCKRCRKVPPQDGPWFVVNLAPSEVNRLVVPVNFWESFSDMLQSKELQLKGPNGAVMVVKAERTFHGEERELGVRLESGWKEFFVANNLRIGDHLEFSLVGPSCFLVDVQPF